MTNDPENRRRWARPAYYDPRRYELLLRYFDAGLNTLPLHVRTPIPNGKSDTNNSGAFSSDNIGMNYDYANGDYETRERIIMEHEIYVRGLCYTLATNPRVPIEIRRFMMDWGLAEDEFVDNSNWPYRMYIREARRMVGDYVMTEQNCLGGRRATDSVGMGSYQIDSHNVQRFVDDNGFARNEGDIQVSGFVPYPISYKSIIPARGECGNLLVPVCVSASHVAYGSIRMEPVYMVLGQSAGTAAVLAIIGNTDVQHVDYGALRQQLLSDGQMLDRSFTPEELEGIVVDNAMASLDGDWVQSESEWPFVGSGYMHDDNTQGGKTASFEARVPYSGQYEVRFYYTPHANRATNVSVRIAHAFGDDEVTIDEKQVPVTLQPYAVLEDCHFFAHRPAVIEVNDDGADGYVIIDAVQLVPISLDNW
jgi:hypothetical protein